jgi:hypothetical protein
MLNLHLMEFPSLGLIAKAFEHVSCLERSGKLLPQDALAFTLTADDPLHSTLNGFPGGVAAVGIGEGEEAAFKSPGQTRVIAEESRVREDGIGANLTGFKRSYACINSLLTHDWIIGEGAVVWLVGYTAHA